MRNLTYWDTCLTNSDKAGKLCKKNIVETTENHWKLAVKFINVQFSWYILALDIEN